MRRTDYAAAMQDTVIGIANAHRYLYRTPGAINAPDINNRLRVMFGLDYLTANEVIETFRRVNPQ